MPDSLIDLADLQVGAEDFLVAVLETTAQPIWVVDPDGVIRFANPAAITALGYDSADELFGRRSHETIHHSYPDGTPYPAADCPMLLPRVTGETVAGDLDWFFRRDGSMFPVSYVSVPLEMRDGRGAVVAFTDIEERLRAERELRERDEALAAEQASLRRIAMLVAGGAGSADVVAAVAREVASLLELQVVGISRYESDGTMTVIGAWSDRPQPFRAGTHWPLDAPTVAAEIKKTGRPARRDYANLPGAIADAARANGIGSAAGAPIVVDGDVWGMIATTSWEGEPLPDRIEDRLAEFTALIAPAFSNTASRDEVARLADEQAALRRVATLVARQSSPAEVLRAVAEEVAELLDTDGVGILRFEPDGTATLVAQSATPWDPVPLGTRFSLEGENVVAAVLRTAKTARLDDWGSASGAVADEARSLGIRSSVATPIVVEGRLWGTAVAVTAQAEPLPADIESRIGEFTELVATAISNSDARTELAASRARLVAAADEERRRVVRDLHDGAQQRLVHTVITMKLACEALDTGDDAGALVSESLAQVEAANAELRELAHGILPGVLASGGLRPGVEALASRTPVPVDIGVSVGRLPPAVEATAYFVVSEALTNVAKHSRAERAEVTACVEDSELRVQVRDDGVGGARPDGSGLLGLGDRIAALDGRFRVETPAGGGTLVTAHIPLRDQ